MRRALDWFVRMLEWLSAGLLAVLGIMTVIGFFAVLVTSRGSLSTTETFLVLLDKVLVLLLIIELFKTVSAYMTGKSVIPAVLEAVVVALTRKTVALDLTAEGSFKKAAAIALLTASVGLTWYLISRSPWGRPNAPA